MFSDGDLSDETNLNPFVNLTFIFTLPLADSENVNASVIIISGRQMASIATLTARL